MLTPPPPTGKKRPGNAISHVFQENNFMNQNVDYNFSGRLGFERNPRYLVD